MVRYSTILSDYLARKPCLQHHVVRLQLVEVLQPLLAARMSYQYRVGGWLGG